MSTHQQDLACQVKTLKRAGCTDIHSDTASGKSLAGRPELAAALDGDELVIAEWAAPRGPCGTACRSSST